ncbi:MAG: phosphatase PAP2 family protein [Halorientalis sp.]
MTVVRADRSLGIADRLHWYAEGPLLLVFALVTQLGDVWFLFALGGALYAAGTGRSRLAVDRRRGLFVLALAFTYVALVGVLKPVFALPRPPGAGTAPLPRWLPAALSVLYENAATATGSGFPSGHALGSTMVWGGVALVLNGSRRARAGLAGAIVAAVSLSRLVLGVHYVVDVIAGAALGVVVLLSCYRLADGGTEPGRVLRLAVAIGVAGLVVGVTFDTATAIGGPLGAWLAWRGVGASVPEYAATHREAIGSVAALTVVGGAFGGLYLLQPSAPIAFAGSAVVGAGVVGAPLAGSRLA